MMRKIQSFLTVKRVLLIIIILGVVILAYVTIFSHPLLISPRRVASNVLKITPMGMHIDDVVDIVKTTHIVKGAEKSREPIINYEGGYLSPDDNVPGWPSSRPLGHGQSIVGHKSVSVAYCTHFHTYFSINWGFDEDGKLIDVCVNKALEMIELGTVRRTAE